MNQQHLVETPKEIEAPELVEETTEEPVEETTKETTEEPVEETTEEPQPGDVPAADLYKMDRSYKSLDKDYEIPEFAAAGVKNEEDAKALRDVYEKAQGVDFLKEKNTGLKTERDGYKENFEKNNQTLQYLDHLVQNKDVANIQKMARLTDDDVLNRAAEILEIKNLTPEQQQAYTNNVAQRNQNYFSQLENATLRQQLDNSSSHSQSELLDQTLVTPDVSEISNFYDSKMGQAGSFRKRVIDTAAQVEMSSQGKNVLTPQQAVDMVLQEVKPFFSPKEEKIEPVAEATSTTTQVDPRSKPVIPSVKGGSKSPAKKVFKSIQDLKDHAAKMDD